MPAGDSAACRRKTNRQWDEVLRGATAPSIRETASFFAEAGIAPIVDWDDAVDLAEKAATLFVLLLGDYHPLARSFTTLLTWLDSKRRTFTQRARRHPSLPSEFIQRLNADIGLWCDSVEDEDAALLLPNWAHLQHDLAANNAIVRQRAGSFDPPGSTAPPPATSSPSPAPAPAGPGTATNTREPRHFS